MSSFDTSKAKDGVTASTNGHETATMQNMFQNNYRLERITLGPNFTFRGDGTTTNTSHYAALHAPSADYISDADGNWYDIDRNAFAASAIPSNVTDTYYASVSVTEKADNELVLVKNGSLIRTGKTIRAKNGTQNRYRPSEFAMAISNL